jgi:hypothetical protein
MEIGSLSISLGAAIALLRQSGWEAAGRFKDELVAVKVESRKRDVVVDTDEYPTHARRSRRSPTCVRLSIRMAPSPPAMLQASMTAAPTEQLPAS